KQYWGPGPEGIFYTPTTGIWQPVWLEPLPDRHITGIRVRPDFSEGAVHFGVGGEGGIELVARLDGEVVGTWSGRAGDGRMQLAAQAREGGRSTLALLGGPARVPRVVRDAELS